MKTHLALALLTVLASAITSRTLAASAPKIAYAHPVSAVEHSSSETIVRGSPEFEVRRLLGNPVEELNDAVWIYHHYCAGAAQSPDDNCTLLMVTMVNGRVSDLNLINDRARVIFAKRIQTTKNADPMAVAAK